MKKGLHIGVVSGNMFLQINNGGFLEFLAPTGAQGVTLCVCPSVRDKFV